MPIIRIQVDEHDFVNTVEDLEEFFPHLDISCHNERGRFLEWWRCENCGSKKWDCCNSQGCESVKCTKCQLCFKCALPYTVFFEVDKGPITRDSVERFGSIRTYKTDFDDCIEWVIYRYCFAAQRAREWYYETCYPVECNQVLLDNMNLTQRVENLEEQRF